MDLRDLSPIDGDEMVGLATTEYERLVALLRTLPPDDWGRPTPCEGWTVQDIVAHLVGAAEANASVPENLRQLVRGARPARRKGRPVVDGVNDVQIADRRHLTPEQLVDRLEAVAARAIRGRRRTPGPLRRFAVPSPVDGKLTLGHLVDVVYTRDQWMHRVDLSRATDRELTLTPDHDARIVADVAAEWARHHGEPVALELTGPAGGSYRAGSGGPRLRLDAVDFCLAVSGRTTGEGLLAVAVVF
jgi:uncharacterized protein (TIGR03083 family)